MAGSRSTAPRRYAEALYDIGTRDAKLEEYGEGLDAAAQTLGEDVVLGVLRNPALPVKQRTDLVASLVAKRVPEPVLRLAALMVERGRIDRIADVAAEYRRLLNRDHGVVEALATTASALTDQETEALRQKVAGMTGRTVELTVKVDESLLGGLTVRVGDTLYDASVRGRLERLRERLLAGAR
jgi:F-type H+-transporting ATPase subunit delta